MLSRFHSTKHARPSTSGRICGPLRPLTALAACFLGLGTLALCSTSAQAGQWQIEIASEGSTSYDHPLNEWWYFLTIAGPSNSSGKGTQKWGGVSGNEFQANANYVIAPDDAIFRGKPSQAMTSDINMKGSVTARLKWIPQEGAEETDLPPTKIEVVEESHASAEVEGNNGGVGLNHAFDSVTQTLDCGLSGAQTLLEGTANYPIKKAEQTLRYTWPNPARSAIVHLPTRHLEASSRGAADGAIDPFQRVHGVSLRYEVSASADANRPGGDARVTILRDRRNPDFPTELQEVYESDLVGGRLWAGVEFDVKPNSRISPATKQVQLRVKEEKDKELGTDQHPDTENHVDPTLPLSPTGGNDYKWQKRLNNSGEWQDTSEAFTTPNLSQSDTVNYRVLWPWNTSKPIQLDSKLWDHNGAHTVALVSATAGQKQVRFEAADDPADSILVKDFYERKVPVKNLVIENVSTSNGTSDYFKFNSKSEDEFLRYPKIFFSIEDSQDFHFYRWRVRVRGTNIEDQIDSVVYEGTARSSEKVEVKVNQSAVAAEFDANTRITDAGAYNFEISVLEYASRAELDAAIAASRAQRKPQEGASLDKATLRSTLLYIPYDMPAPNQGKKGHDGEIDFTDELRPVWHLSHYFKQKEGSGSPVTDARVTLLPPDLSDALAEVPMPSNYNTPYSDRVFYTFKPGEWRNNKVWIAVTTAKDANGTTYRDHKRRSMLAKNDREARTSKPEVISVTPAESSKILISALYGGGYPCTEQAILAQAPKQNEDAFAKVRVTAVVKDALPGDVVTFEVTDPDDASPYAEDTTPETTYDYTERALDGKLDIAASSDNNQPDNGNDNRDLAKNGRDYAAFQTQCLATRRVTIGEEGTEKLADGTWKAWTTLSITQRFGGDNYIVNATAEEASLDQSFAKQQELKDKFKSSGLLVAWKRVYSDFNRSYAKGADLMAPFPLSSNPNQDVEQKAKVAEVLADGEDYDVLFVRSVEDFTIGDTLILWSRNDPAVETTVVRIDNAHKALVVSRITLGEMEMLGGATVTQTFPVHSGVRIKGKEELSREVSLANLPVTYGGAADGRDGGAFVEFHETGGWILPNAKYFSSLYDGILFISNWNKTPVRINQFHMSFVAMDSFASGFVGVALNDKDGLRDQPGEGMGLTAVSYLESYPWGGTYPTQSESGERNALAHEFGHLLGRIGDGNNTGGNHIDRKSSFPEDTDAIDHEGKHICVMSYAKVTAITTVVTNFEFDVDCLYGVRDKETY